MIKQLRIEYDPESYGMPKVTDAETGKPFGVTSIKLEWNIHDRGPPRLTIETYQFGVSVTGAVQVITLCPQCGKEMPKANPGPVKPPPPPPAPPRR